MAGGGPREGGVRGVGEGEVSGGRATAGRGQGGERGTVAAGAICGERFGAGMPQRKGASDLRLDFGRVLTVLMMVRFFFF